MYCQIVENLIIFVSFTIFLMSSYYTISKENDTRTVFQVSDVAHVPLVEVFKWSLTPNNFVYGKQLKTHII